MPEQHTYLGLCICAECRCARLTTALREAVGVIKDYLAYEHDGDPWVEDARLMGEMSINEYARDGRLAYAQLVLAAESKGIA